MEHFALIEMSGRTSLFLPPINDAFENYIDLGTSASGSFFVNFAGVTYYTNSDPSVNNVWYRWTPPAGRVFVRSPNTSVHFGVGAYTGTANNNLITVSGGRKHKSTWIADGTTTYILSVSCATTPPLAGNHEFFYGPVTGTPPNDDIQDAIPLVIANGAITYSAAVMQSSTYQPSELGASYSVWHTFTSPVDSYFRFTVNGFDANHPSDVDFFHPDDITPNLPAAPASGTHYYAFLDWDTGYSNVFVEANTTYYVQIGNRTGAGVDVSWESYVGPAGDAWDSPVELSPTLGGSTVVPLSDATHDYKAFDYSAYGSIWYRYTNTSNESQTLILHTLDNPTDPYLDTYLAVFTDGVFPNSDESTLIVGNEDADDWPGWDPGNWPDWVAYDGRSYLELSAAPNTSYLIHVTMYYMTVPDPTLTWVQVQPPAASLSVNSSLSLVASLVEFTSAIDIQVNLGPRSTPAWEGGVTVSLVDTTSQAVTGPYGMTYGQIPGDNTGSVVLRARFTMPEGTYVPYVTDLLGRFAPQYSLSSEGQYGTTSLTLAAEYDPIVVVNGDPIWRVLDYIGPHVLPSGYMPAKVVVNNNSNVAQGPGTYRVDVMSSESNVIFPGVEQVGGLYAQAGNAQPGHFWVMIPTDGTVVKYRVLRVSDAATTWVNQGAGAAYGVATGYVYDNTSPAGSSQRSRPALGGVADLTMNVDTANWTLVPVVPTDSGRWKLETISKDRSYIFEINPNDQESPWPNRDITWDHGNLGFSGRRAGRAPHAWSFSGVLRSQAQYLEFVDWVNIRTKIQLTTDLGQVFVVRLTSIRLQQEGSPRYASSPHRQTYTINALVYDTPAPV